MVGEKGPCVFCEIVEGRSPAYRIYENDRSVAILDIQPFARGHTLVLSRRHVGFWHELEADESASLFEAAREVARRIMRSLRPDFVCMYARGRRIPHTHIFLVPSFGGDVLDRFFNTLEGFQEAPGRLAELKQPATMEETARLLQARG